MKKYEKPMIVLEKFELNHSIANCSPAMNHQRDTCDYDSDELFGFINSGDSVFYDGCTMSWDDFNSVNEGFFCLQTGSDGFNLFTS